MGNNKLKTIDEFFIQKYEELERENRDLKAKCEMCEIRYNKLKVAIEQIAKDFGVRLVNVPNAKYIGFSNTIWNNHEKEEYEYFKNLFNLKEEGENDNEQ